MIGARISTDSTQIKKCYLIMHNTPQTQDVAYMIVNHRRKHKILEACNCFNFFTYFFVYCNFARHLSKLNRVIFNNLVKRT